MARIAHRQTRRGAILPLVALLMIILVGFIALAVDLGVMAVARNQCQNAADAAATAGARTFNGTSGSTNYGFAQVPGKAIMAATKNYVMAKNVQGDPTITVDPAVTVYTTGQVKIEMGAYAYFYSDDAKVNSVQRAEGFFLDLPRVRGTDPWSAVRATVTVNNSSTNFGTVFGMSSFNSQAVATAVHRPRDVVIIMDLSGSMRFQSLPGTPYDSSQSLAMPSSSSDPRVKSMNPESVFPQFGHYSDTTGAAFQGSTAYATTTNEYVDPSNFSSNQNPGPPVIADFYKNPAGTALTTSNQSTYTAFTRASDTYATTPGGDNYLTSNWNTGTAYAKTTSDILGSTSQATRIPGWETRGYQNVTGSSFNLYTQGPGYWGKTFFTWPPCTRTPTTVNVPPSSLTDTSSNWYNNQSDDWRNRFFVAVNTATNAPSWVNHNSILFDTATYLSSDPTTPALKKPGTTTAVVESTYSGTTGSTATNTYTYRINYAAILYWLKNMGTNSFPTTLQAGRIRYYSSIPDGTDNTLNKRWWAFDPSNPNNSATIPKDEQFWKGYIDFVLGFYATGPNTYNRYQNGTAISSLIGNGNWFVPSGHTVLINQRPQPQPATSNPSGPYYSTTVNKSGGYSSGATSIVLSSLPAIPTGISTVGTAGITVLPVPNRDYVTFNADTSHPYLITNVNTGTNAITLGSGLSSAIANGVSVQIFSPTMVYTDNPPRPRHQFWFGPMTFVDWLGNYNTNLFWWPGNVHEAHAWACKVGIQTAVQDIENNHPSDYIALTFFSSPMTSGTSGGHHNKAVVALGRNYQKIMDSLWFPPTTVTGSISEISPYDADMDQVPRANGGTAPGMGFMIAYNQLSSSATNLRTYSSPSTSYRGLSGGLGRKGASRLIIFETDGAPNTRAYDTLGGTGSDSYYQIRVKNPANMADSLNVEWPTGGTYAQSEVTDVATQICALDSATTPGFSKTNKPVLIHCIGYGSIFDPNNSSNPAQANALGFLQAIQTIGKTQASASTPLQSYKRIYGTWQNRIDNMRTAFTTIMQDGVQITLIQ
jgi:Flp pilus assembly protein TadG